MIDRQTFYTRLEICKQCSWWNGACLKGHALTSPVGCPVRKFEPIQAADYAPDRLVELPLPGEAPKRCCGAVPEPLKPLTLPEALAHMKQSLAAWKAAGFPTLTGKPYADRIATCKNCPSGFYAWFQCSQCRCIVYSKALLATEHCPAGHW